MTFKIINDDSHEIVFQYNARLGNDILSRKLRIDITTTPTIIKSRQENFVDNDTFFTATWK